MLSLMFWNAPPGGGAVKLSFVEIAHKLEMKAVTVGRAMKKMESGHLIIPAWEVGKTTFYRVNPLLNYDGRSAQQRAATYGVPVPLVPHPDQVAADKVKQEELEKEKEAAA
ncbi:hypothetical protein ACFXJO_42675 [Streptomyces lavendulae]|uniref:hypothetical protein n=1 Tax=Streptomyces lavendulae TaxID=1914 RepID=UPI003673EACE